MWDFFYINVANFEAFGWTFFLSANLLFLNSDISYGAQMFIVFTT